VVVTLVDIRPRRRIERVRMHACLGLRPGLRLSLSLSLAASVPEGLDIARQLQPDLMLVDMMMPGMSGLWAVPCVAVSANAMPHQIEAALAAGLDGYLTKPLSATDLL
jgi:CheY-like chemotaxis protein